MTHTEVLTSLDSAMAMKPAEWLLEQMVQNSSLVIIDLRAETKFRESRIPESIQCSIQELPFRADSLIPSKEHTVVMVCNGSIQSAMAVVWLRCEGYEQSFNLSGGFSSWQKNERPLQF